MIEEEQKITDRRGETVEENRKKGILYIVVPCYNEEEALLPSAKSLLDKLDALRESGIVSDKSRIVFVDDGSRDKTWELITQL